MCANNMISSDEKFNTDIIEKYNNEIQQKRIESSMIEIIENLEKLYFDI